MSMAADVAALLVATGAGVFGRTSDWGIFVGREPTGKTGPAKSITVIDTGATSEDVGGDEMSYWSVQVRVRAKDYQAASSKADDVRVMLAGAESQTINGRRYVQFISTTGITFLGWDDNDRAIFVLNIRSISQPDGT